MNETKFTLDESTLAQTIISIFPRKGGEISKEALATLYATRRGIPKEQINIKHLTEDINEKLNLPKRQSIKIRRGHRDEFVKILPITRRRLRQLVS